MTRYSAQPRDRIFVKGYGFVFRNIGKIISKSSHKLLDYAKQSATDALKTASKRAIQRNSRSN